MTPRAFIYAFMIAIAGCGGGRANGAENTTGIAPAVEQGEAPQTEATAVTTATHSDLSADNTQSRQDEIKARLLDSSESDEHVELTLEASMLTRDGVTEVYRAAVSELEMETHFLVITRPAPNGHMLFATSIGEVSMTPGSEYVVELSDVTTPVLAHGILRVDFALTSTSAEFATGGECQQRSQSPEVREEYSLLCDAEECAALPRSLAIVEAGYESNCAGTRGPSSEAPPSEFTGSVEVIAGGQVRLSHVRGTAGQLDGVLSMDAVHDASALRTSRIDELY